MFTRDFLRATPLFAALGDADADALVALGREETYKKGQVIFREREPSGKLYLVVAGVVEISKLSPGSERPAALARLERGDILGEVSAFDGAPRTATASAAVTPEARVAVWDMEDFQSFLAARPVVASDILRRLVKTLGERLRRTSEAVQVLIRALGH
ncbi:MAG TPA: cyclic nucleotide-binding domain-containing protein [Planctomycetota bacterium]